MDDRFRITTYPVHVNEFHKIDVLGVGTLDLFEAMESQLPDAIWRPHPEQLDDDRVAVQYCVDVLPEHREAVQAQLNNLHRSAMVIELIDDPREQE